MRRSTIITLALTIPISALHAQAGDPPSRAARISALTGQASLQPSGATDWSEAALNYTVTTGDRIYTGPGSRLELEVGPMSVRLSDNSDVTVTNLTDGFMQLGLEQGTVRLSVYRLVRGDTVEVDTPNGAIMVTTPGEYLIDIPDNDQFTVVTVEQGGVEVIGPGVNQIMRSGQTVQLSGTDNIRANSIPRPVQTPFDRWGSERDQRVSSSACSRYMNRDIPGCADLDDAGHWDPNPQYGVVWYPTHVAAGWVPYRDGRWVWIDPWGWSWVADEPWGYAPFHYGRWAQFGAQWGWIPGPVTARPYYAPALVAFVGGSGWSVGVSVGTQAWFPLGPREAYIPSYHHDDVYLRQVNSSNVRNVTNITTIINVTNVNQVNYVNRRAGITAVPTETFRSGRPVSKDAVHVAPENIGRGSIISHPSAAPIATAVLGGRPAPAPPHATLRPPMITTESPRNGRGAQSRGEPARAQPQKAAPPQAQPPKAQPRPTPAPSPSAPPIAPQPKRPDQPPTAQRPARTIITRTPPPPQAPPFQAKEPALQAHPGKPLEPQQMQNLRGGRPAGPPKDPETADHRVVPTAPAARPPAAAPAKQPTRPTPTPTPKPKPTPVPPEAGRGRGGKPDSTGRGKKPPQL